MKSAQTENSFFADKVQLRLDHLPAKDPIRVLDCFSADGSLWREVQRQAKAKLQVLRIEKEKGKRGTYLWGDNLKYLSGLDLSSFDVVDLDAFGVPYKQLKILFERQYKGDVYVTCIAGMAGIGSRIPDAMLEEVGYTAAMVKKIPSLFARHPRRVLLAYLARHGVRRASIISIGRKHYLHFRME